MASSQQERLGYSLLLRDSEAVWEAMQVNLKLFQPDPNKPQTVLLFVFRDRTKTPLSRLVETWEEDLRQIWDSLAKPAAFESCQFSDLFEVGCPAHKSALQQQ